MRPEVQRNEIQAHGINGAHWTDIAIGGFAETSPCTPKVSIFDFRGDRISTAPCRHIVNEQAWTRGNHDRDKEDTEQVTLRLPN